MEPIIQQEWLYIPTTETDYGNIVYSYNKAIINKTEEKETSARPKFSSSTSHYQNSIKISTEIAFMYDSSLLGINIKCFINVYTDNDIS